MRTILFLLIVCLTAEVLASPVSFDGFAFPPRRFLSSRDVDHLTAATPGAAQSGPTASDIGTTTRPVMPRPQFAVRGFGRSGFHDHPHPGTESKPVIQRSLQSAPQDLPLEADLAAMRQPSAYTLLAYLQPVYIAALIAVTAIWVGAMAWRVATRDRSVVHRGEGAGIV